MNILRPRTPTSDFHWHALAGYNAEVARGLIHTPEWQAKMAEDQAAFDAWQTSLHLNNKSVIIVTGKDAA